ncbi:DNA polymerase [Clostridium saudiense]|uniref:DNA polymerase n=1 Tax=Clostridium saudiense TaxID=1414720 RepID=UPI0004ACC57F|nr:DNA polymerase [Clostridium saudiense]
MKRTLAIDIETYSDVDLVRSGVYAYTTSPKFEILLFAYSFDDDEVKVIDLATGETLPNEIILALEDEKIIKTAFNANFERVCLSKYLNKKLSAKSWRCTAVQAASLGLPLSLDGVAQVLGLQKQKMKEGKELIKYFSVPCKPTKSNGERNRNYPHHSLERWEVFKKYCAQDVEVEKAIRKRLERYPIITSEQEIYVLDQEINDRGILIDTKLVEKSIECENIHKEDIYAEAQKLTGLENPNSVIQLKQWLLENGVEVESLSKKTVADLAKDAEEDVQRLLNLRSQLSKTSVKKYEAIERVLCADKRVRGLLQFYGANRTGRWAGRLVQVQNLPQNHIKDLTLARDLVKNGEFETLDMLFDNVSQVLSELIRTAFIPKENHRFIVADFSAIEARVIAWLAEEKWRLDVFNSHGKIYEASASQMFKIPIEEITKTSPLRQKGKISELALGYGGSVGALAAMGALDMGVKEEELQGLVSKWRQANPNITKLWWDIDKAAIKVVKEKSFEVVGKIKIFYEKGIMFITLPSGRNLSYIKPRLETNKFGRKGITYEGIGATKKWERIETYGPKLVENIVQATARDLLAEAMINVDKKGYEIVMHVHDEIIVETPIGKGSLKEVCDVMAIAPEWAKGLPLRADGFECEYYRKD